MHVRSNLNGESFFLGLLAMFNIRFSLILFMLRDVEGYLTWVIGLYELLKHFRLMI